MTLQLYNTLTHEKAPFEPLDPERVRVYACGPTVYDYAHIGNARTFTAFDLLFRVLRHEYGPEHVVYARNITDIDDKIMERAVERGKSIAEVTERTTQQFHADMAALNLLEPTLEPRATDHVPQMVAMIERLVELGYAYEAQGHVLFSVASDKSYGTLSRRSVDDMIAGARVEVAPYKQDPMDFVLWKPSTEDQPGWDSPWGKGRPGWHLECSAMTATHFGEVFDIHCGGVDLIFPHHENEIAQSTCAHGTELMARVWMHAGFLQVEGEKMSKSLGNFLTVHDLLRRFPGEVLRLHLLMTQYRQPLNWTEAGVREAWTVLD
ncbi:MAG: cysteine--tRNA ligase, partial [Alphaproteobacteria bacterium]